MGTPSTFEDIEERRADARFCDHEAAPDLKALKVAPVAKRPTKRAGPNLVDQLKGQVARQAKENAKLIKRLKAAEQQAASARAHVEQLKARENKNSDLLLQAENCRLQAVIDAKETELRDLRKMIALFGKNG